ncbi:glycoside hydrolase N-terminal domain-containing protein [Promicromonospora sp. Populi]|uniref:glycosyl hydrolase family 95 catalytic domain-containing protein n=1 Tax=Promicromonospora sp. Populi TaxID=3239420 RepID=UPI0034E1CE12
MTRESSRRDFLRLTGVAGAGLALGGGRPFAAHAAPARPVASPAIPAVPAGPAATTLWYPDPAVESRIIEEGLPIGNGRLGGLVTGDPGDDALYLTDGSFWSGGLNDVLQDDGQLPYGRDDFGSFGLLAKVRITVPGHTGAAVSDYRRQLDLSNGIVSASYRHGGRRLRRETYISHPDDVVVIRLSGGRYTGTITLDGTHEESTVGGGKHLSFAGALDNGLRYAAALTAVSSTGSVVVDGGINGGTVSFTDCEDLLVVVCAGTDYAPDAARDFRDPSADPLGLAIEKVTTAARVRSSRLRATHVEDYRRLFDRMTINLGASAPAQRALDSWSRLKARNAEPGTPDPELEATYVQYGRYLTITGSRDALPMNLQGLWVHNNTPDWYADYHTDINIQMNYWLADPAGLGELGMPLADYCVAQLPAWTDVTRRLFNDPRNRFRNSTGEIAGWAVAFSTNIHGGSGWAWHPSGNAWLCGSLWRHYEYSHDIAYLEKIYPVLRGAAEFWQARLIPTTVTDPATGAQREVLIDDTAWSPEHGPDAKGTTYAQELTWDLFQQVQVAARDLGRDAGFAAELADLQSRLYLPEVSPETGWLQEWMTPGNLGEVTHRHLSPLMGFYPGDRISTDTSPAELIDGVRNLLIARGMDSFGWATAWRSLCWSRLKDAERAYQLYLTVLRPSVNNGNGTSANFFDMYSQGSYTIFQIDANLGGAAAALEMILYSRPGVIELLPALPAAWADRGSVTGVGARGGFEVDVTWRDGAVTSATIRSVGGRETEVRAGQWRRQIRLQPGQSVTIRP